MKKTPAEIAFNLPTATQRLAASAVDALTRDYGGAVKVHVEKTEFRSIHRPPRFSHEWLAVITDDGGEMVTGETAPFGKEHAAIFEGLDENDTPVLVSTPTETLAYAYVHEAGCFRFIAVVPPEPERERPPFAVKAASETETRCDPKTLN